MTYYLTQEVVTPKGKHRIMRIAEKHATFLINGKKEQFSYKTLDKLNTRDKGHAQK